MAWENWDDTGTKGKGKLLKSTLNELRSAMVERCDVTGRTIPANVSVVASGELDFVDWFSAFQTEMTALIPLFTNNALTYVGVDTSITKWNTTTITAETEEGSRLSVPTDPLLGRKWYFQQYELLNLLVWKDESLDYTAGRYKQSGVQTTQAAAETAFDAAGYTNDGSIDYGEYINFSNLVDSYNIYLQDAKITFTADANHKHVTDIYVYSEDDGVYAPYDIGPYTGGNALRIAYSVGEQTLGATYTTNFLFAPYLSGNHPEGQEVRQLDYTQFYGATVKKYDSANGFEYQ